MKNLFLFLAFILGFQNVLNAGDPFEDFIKLFPAKMHEPMRVDWKQGVVDLSESVKKYVDEDGKFSKDFESKLQALGSKVKILNLSGNGLTELNVLSSLWNLNVLDLSSNRFEYFDGPEDLTELRRLNLSKNELIEVEVGSLKSLRNLDLSDNELTQVSVQGLRILNNLNVSNNRFETKPHVPQGCRLIFGSQKEAE